MNLKMETEPLFLSMDRREIGFFRFLLEAYEGIGVLSTLDRDRGLVMVRVAPGCMELVMELAGVLLPPPLVLGKNEMEALGFPSPEVL